LSAEAQDKASGVQAVKFYVWGIDFLERVDKRKPRHHLIGVDSTAPYEAIWDCSRIPDFHFPRLRFYCDIIDNAGNIAEKAGGTVKYVVLDRHAEFKSKKFRSKFFTKSPVLDGQKNDWPASDSLQFENGNNTITAFSFWNRDGLFFFIRVMDQQVFTPMNRKWQREIHYGDGIHLLLDPFLHRNPFPDSTTRLMEIAPNGFSYIKYFDLKKTPDGSPLKDFGKTATSIKGKLNDLKQPDSSYTMEIKIDWPELAGLTAEAGSLGFDLLNMDVDQSEGIRKGISWTGNQPYNRLNPSEWGVLILEKPPLPFKSWGIAAAFFFILIIGGVALFRKHSKIKQSVSGVFTQSKKSDDIIDLVTQAVLKRYPESELSISFFAKEFSMNPGYLGNLFRKKTGKPFNEFLHQVRINEAKRLLKMDQLSISQIAFQVGFNSLENFIRIFKKYEKVSPGSWQKSGN